MVPRSPAYTTEPPASESEPRPEGRGQPPSRDGVALGGGASLGLFLVCVARLAFVAAVLGSLPAGAQFKALEVASVLPSAPVAVQAGKAVTVPVSVRIRRGYHINSVTPAESYLIPTKLTWDVPGFKAAAVKFPDAEVVNYDFSDKPLSVYSGTIQISSTLEAPAKLPAGLTGLSGKFRYQACNNKSCLPPRTTEFKVPVAAK